MQLKRALRVVVVSPGDVPQERDAVEKVLKQVAQGMGRDRGLAFDVGRWEADALRVLAGATVTASEVVSRTGSAALLALPVGVSRLQRETA